MENNTRLETTDKTNIVTYGENAVGVLACSSPGESRTCVDAVDDEVSDSKEGANKRGNSSRLTQSFHFFMFEPIFSPVNALNQPI